jgi:hypothetical protein
MKPMTTAQQAILAARDARTERDAETVEAMKREVLRRERLKRAGRIPSFTGRGANVFPREGAK